MLGGNVREAGLELLERMGLGKPIRTSTSARFREYVATLFDRQKAVMASRSRRNGVCCTRRAGKSKMIPALLFEAGDKYPGTVVYYVHPDGGTRAWDTIMGPDINLGAINEDYGLGWTLNHNRRSLTHPTTRTEIRARGADDMRELKKFRGDKVSRVVVDESQNFPGESLRELVEDHLGPALAETRGQWFLFGTPGDVCSGFWYEVTRNETPEALAARKYGWDVFAWSALDNPSKLASGGTVSENIRLEIAPRIVAASGGTVSEDEVLAMLATPEGRAKAEALASGDPSTLREWFGKWVNDSGALFYAFDARRNLYVPSERPVASHVWFNVAGADLGTGDDYAHHVWAVSATHPIIYEVESFSQAGLHAGQWREHVADVFQRFNPVAFVVDEGGLGKGVCDEWRTVYGLQVEPAQKTHKAAAVAMLNAELREGRIKVLAGPVGSLQGGATAKDWASLRKAKGGTPGTAPTEDPSQKNHAADSALYSFREALRLTGREDTPRRRETPEERARRQDEEHQRRLIEQIRAEEDTPPWE